MKYYMKRSGHWMLLFLLTDAACVFVVWIIRREAMRYVSLFLLLFTALTCIAGILAECFRQKKEADAFLRFLETPDDETKNELLQRIGDSETLETFCAHVFGQAARTRETEAALTTYRDYIEAWVHEAKTPLSLSALVLENHREEMSPYVYARMRYIQHQLTEDVERILFYARLEADHADYKFTRFRLDECLSEVLADYRMLTEEKGIAVEPDLLPLEVISDRKVIFFMLSQLLDNAVKYADSRKGRISLSMVQKADTVCLGIYNNGEGVPPEDAPFLFDKGFTGNQPNRQKATGMGLYLVRKYAEKLCVEVRLAPLIPFESGFGIEMIFSL